MFVLYLVTSFLVGLAIGLVILNFIIKKALNDVNKLVELEEKKALEENRKLRAIIRRLRRSKKSRKQS